MQNNTPFSRDLTPDLTRTILSVVKEGLLGKLKKKVSRFGQGLRDVGGDGPASPSDRLRIARWDRAHRTEGDIQRAHMKHKARATVKEDYQTRERDRQIANLGKPVPAIDSKEKASKKVYGKDGRVEHKSLADMLKKANKKSTVKEEQEYIERLEFALESIAEELECDVEDLLEDMAQTPARSAVLDRAEKKSLKSIRKQRNSHSDPPTSDKTQKEINHAQSLYSRVDAIRTGAPKQERQRIRAVERARRIKK